MGNEQTKPSSPPRDQQPKVTKLQSNSKQPHPLSISMTPSRPMPSLSPFTLEPNRQQPGRTLKFTPLPKPGQQKFVDSRYTLADSILKMSLDHKIDGNVNNMVQSRLKSLPVSEARVSKSGNSVPVIEQETYDHYLKARFVGEKVDGKPNGFGKLYFENDDYLEGTFVNGRCEGQGRIIKADGSYYEGQIKNNEADGHGKFHDINGYRYEGQWKNNFPNGMGQASYPDGSRYVGQFLNNKRNGNGMYLVNGDVFQGQFKNDKVDGFCKFVDKNGQKYDGEWSKGLKNGKGVYQWPDGKRYEGEYKNDQRHGQGTMYYSEMERYTGQWQNGQKHGEGIYESEKQKMCGLWVKGNLSKILQ